MILHPKSQADLVDVIKSATAPLDVVGGGTRGVYGASRISMAGMTGIERYEPGALTLVVKAGTPVAEVEAVLAAEGQRLAFEPMDHRGVLGTTGAPTMGGVYAMNVSGPRRIQVGAARDFALGVRFVDGRGDVISNGGRVMKNVTGYDLVKLLAGSRGALGVVAELSFKTLPMAEVSAHVAVEVSGAHHAVQVLSAALGSPFDVTGAAWMDGMALVRIEGFEASVHYRLGALKALLGAYGACDTVIGDKSVRAWAAIRTVAPFHDRTGDVWKISVKPSDGPAVVDAVGGDVVMDWGGGLIWACVPVGTDLRPALGALNGHARCVRGDMYGMSANGNTQPVTRLLMGLKQQFDPRGILNAKADG